MSPPAPLRVLVDAQLLKQLARFLAFHAGYDSLHTLDLPAANRTQDGSINRFSMAEQRIVITKDADFVTSSAAHSAYHSATRRTVRCTCGHTLTSCPIRYLNAAPSKNT